MLVPFCLMVAQQAAPPQSLAAQWERLYWSVEARGPLIAVGTDTLLEQPSLPELPAGPLNAADLVARYDATLARCGGVTAVATRTMRLYDPPRNPTALAEKLRDINPEAYWVLLLASLSTGQWQELTSEAGLALRTLSPRQSHWLEGALPANLSFRTHPGATLDRRTFRLHLHRQLEIHVLGSDGKDTALPSGLAPESFETSQSLALQEAATSDDDQLLGKVRVPGREKASALDPAQPTLQPLVVLEGATTVGALLTRIGRATGLELYADPSVAGRTVWSRGRSARAGDVLQALCRGVNGCLRQVGPAYLLVEDLPSAAERRERANAEYQRVLAPQEQETGQLSPLAAGARRRLSRERALERIPRGPQDAPAALWELAEHFDTEGRVPFSRLTPGLQAEVRALHDRQRAATALEGGVEPVAPVAATAQQSLVLELRLPEGQGVATVGELDAEALRPDSAEPEPVGPVVVPETVATRAWQLALPETPQEQDALFALAKRLKVTQLRIALWPDPARETRFAALAAAAKAQKLGVVAVLCPLQAFDPSTPRERNALGLTLAEWTARFATDNTPSCRLARSLAPWGFVVPEALDTSRFVAFAARLSALPGVVGIGLDGLSAPGTPDAEVGDWALWIGGFAPERRLAFLRAHQADPADLIPASPFDLESETTEHRERRALWEAELRTRRALALTALQKALLGAKLPVPLSVRLGDLGKGGSWHALRAPIVLKNAVLDPKDDLALRLVANIHVGLLHVSLLAYDARVSGLATDDAALNDPDAQLRSWLDIELQPATRPTPGHPDHWDGFVLDLADRPLADALNLLEKAFAD
ncbi:hypothetical protein [Armatimonas rosea]|uniref:Uncharacterized protein n=1 Tax=Armatimonas rosea TaxID=685828 RepID=A0A7W9W8Q9_ARMRO|nr:hypothetical protein [Armatimonas rosea]MBB6051857.1 hypothetical protein [Armatimonas rosea]